MNKETDIRGLSYKEVEHSRTEHGENRVSEGKKRGFFAQFFSNLSDPVIRVLIGALVLNTLFSFGDIDIVETVGIAASVLIATFISTVSERGSAAAFERLSSEGERARCRVRRAGELCEIGVEEVVVGDIVLLEAGEVVPADGILVSGELSLDHSAFTGESREIKKVAGDVPTKPSLSDASSLFSGAQILSGEGCMRVTGVGDATLYGAVRGELLDDTRESPLKLRLRSLARTISILGYVAAALVALVYLTNSLAASGAAIRDMRFVLAEGLHALTLAITVVVVAVPEGLPMMIAVVLSSNMKRMTREGVLVKKPVGIEAAGSMNILFTDKTGTLTEGRLTVAEFIDGGGAVYRSMREIERCDRLFLEFIKNVRFNNSAKLAGDGRALGGNATDRALLTYAAHKLSAAAGGTLTDRIPFDSNKKYSAATLDGRVTYIKGAPERILPHVTGYIDGKGSVVPFSAHAVSGILDGITERAGRVIALAVRQGSFSMSELVLIGFVHLRDRIRPAAKKSVRELHGAGVGVVMITGDAKNTALAVARECGIICEKRDMAITSAELALLDDSAVKKIIPRLAVVARALPADKSRLVRLSEELELVVGMTGDGINDSPALKRADIGFAMGSGVQVAKDAGDIVILDNDLASIARAVLYGRSIFKNIRKFITLQLTMNLSAVGISMIGPFIGVESPVTVVQMLWVNIIMDTLGALAFAGESALPEYMKETPKRRDERILSSHMIAQILWLGLCTVGLCIAFLKHPAIVGIYDSEIAHLTAFFAFFIFTSVVNCFNTRTERLNIFANLNKNRTFSLIMLLVLAVQIAFVYLGGSVLRTVPLSARELLFSAEFALLALPINAVFKMTYKKQGEKNF